MNLFLQQKNKLSLISLMILAGIFLSPALCLADYWLEVGLPGLPAGTQVSDGRTFLGQYIRQGFIVGFSLAGFLAVVVIAVAGIMYIMAAGNPGKIDKAKDLIFGAISGIILLLCSYLILSTIDPTLVNLTPPQIQEVNVQSP